MVFCNTSSGLPVPEAAPLLIPATALRTQSKVVPGVALVGLYENIALLQIPGGVNVLLNEGVGFTVIVKVIGVPAQPPATGVTVMVAVTGDAPALTAVNDAMLPVPLAARPMLAVLFVQVYETAVPVNVTAATDVPLHTI